jgi:chromosome segregation ATPase
MTETVKVTPEMLATQREEIETLKGQINQAKGRLAALEAQENDAVTSLQQHGVTPETAPNRIAELEEEISSLYQRVNTVLEEIRNATSNEG